MEKKHFSKKCSLLAFNNVALGLVVSLELHCICKVEPILPLITHIMFTCIRFFLWRSRSFTSRKLHVSVETFLCFFHHFG